MLKNNKIFKTSDLQKLDKYTIENEPVTSLDLMERAATVFTEKLLIFFPNNHIFNILAGFGNNGGDGYVVARLLLKKGLNVFKTESHLSKRGEESQNMNRKCNCELYQIRLKSRKRKSFHQKKMILIIVIHHALLQLLLHLHFQSPNHNSLI